MTNNKGITLIALVITIIVLLILAGVSIAMLTGNNGILTQATNAKDETERAEIAEKVNMAIQAAYAAAVEENTVSPNLTVQAIADVYEEDNNIAEVTATEPVTSEPPADAKLTYTDGGKNYSITLEKRNNSYVTSESRVTITNAS